MTSSALGSSFASPSPFRQTDWDRKLEDMLNELESSNSSSSKQQSFYKGHQIQESSNRSSYKSSASSSYQNKSFSSSNGLDNSDQNYDYDITKNTNKMMKDLEGSINASSNYIQTHRSESGPTGTSEYHEYRTYSSDGGKGGGYDLSNQVQHMMPQPMMSKMESKSSYSASSKGGSNIQTNQMSSYSAAYSSSKYSTSGGEFSQPSLGFSQPPPPRPIEPERPGSSLKQNIDDLDNLLEDLNKQQPAPPERTISKTAMKKMPFQNQSQISQISTYQSSSLHRSQPREAPKQVDDLMSELNQYDGGKDCSFSQDNKAVTTYINPLNQRDLEPEKEVVKEPQKAPKLAGVDFPLADDTSPSALQRADTHVPTMDRNNQKKPKKDKIKGGDNEDKKGAAVVPICLPLCCAAPCVIM